MTDQTVPPPPQAAPPAGRGLKIALAISVALNLAVLGLGFGSAFHHMGRGGGDMVRTIGFGPFSDALSPQDRDALRGRFLQEMPDMRAERRSMVADSTAVLAALRAEPFDPAALDAALSTMSDHMNQRARLGLDLIRDYLAALPPDQRLAFAARLEESLKRGPGK